MSAAENEESLRCDLCGESCAETQANLLACTFKHCEGGMYHQECLEKFLKSNRLEKNRKTGFKCPRGCGKGTKYPEPCPGRIDKSHPIYPRNEEKVKKRQQAVVEQPVAPKPTKAEKQAEKAAKAAAAAAAAAKAKADGAKAKAEQDAANGDAGSKRGTTLQPIGKAAKDKQQLPLHEQLAMAKAAARREMGLAPSQYPSAADAPTSSRDTSGSISRAGSKTLPPVNAWSKSGASSAASEPEQPPPPELPTLGQLPLLQQLLLQSESKRRAKAPAASQQQAHQQQQQTPAPPQFQHSNGSAAAASQQQAQQQQSQPQLDSIQQFPPVSSAAPAVPRFTPLSSYASASVSGAHQQHPPQYAAAAAAAAAQQPQQTQQQQTQQQTQQAQQQQQQQPTQQQQPRPPHSETSELSGELPSLPDGELLDSADPEAAAVAAARLSKAQRKNLKRADKKKKKGGVCDGLDAHTPSESASVAESDHDGSALFSSAGAAAGAAVAAAATAESSLLQQLQADTQGLNGGVSVSEEQCIEALVTHKALHAWQQLQRLGFARWQAAAALQACGLALLPGVEWLLTRAGERPQQLAAAASASASSSGLPFVDISADLAHLQDAQAILRAPQDLVHRAVVKTRGDVHAAVMSLAQAGAPPLHRPAIRHSHQPSGESFHSAQSDMQSLPSQDLGSLDAFPPPSSSSYPHRLSSMGHPQSLSSTWLPGLASPPNGTGSPSPGLAAWEASSASSAAWPQQPSLAAAPTGASEGGGGSRLSAWLRSDQRSVDQAPMNSVVGASSLAAWGGSSSGQFSLEGLSSEGNPWGSSILGQYSSASQQDPAGSLLGLIR